MGKFINKNNALERSQSYHHTMFDKLSYDGGLGEVHKNYHKDVMVWQREHKRIMPKKSRTNLYNKFYKNVIG